MRAIWSGTISFGLVSVAVRMYSATESKELRSTFSTRTTSSDRVRQGPQGHGQERRSRRRRPGLRNRERQVRPDRGRRPRPAGHRAHPLDRHLRFRRPGRDRPDLLPQGVLPPSPGRREAVPAARPRARRYGEGRHRQGRDPEQAAPRGASAVRRRPRARDDVLRGRDPEARQGERHGESQKAEVDMAKSLVENLSADFKPEKYDDTYRKELLALIRRRRKARSSPSRRRQRRPRSST